MATEDRTEFTKVSLPVLDRFGLVFFSIFSGSNFRFTVVATHVEF
jgi:hypothetical protein